MEVNQALPLVSVPVITYNSSRFVIETLESIKAQTYPRLELVISDDCSTDNTVDICRSWLETNRDRFESATIVTSPINTGVSANANRAERACRGEWVKGIAGDDLLMCDAIETYVSHILENPDHYFCFAKIVAFGSGNSYFNTNIFDYSFFNLNSTQQLQTLFSANCLPASTFFYKRSEMIRLRVRNDEKIPFLEDWPKWINLLKKGASFNLIERVTVQYRLRNDSLSTGKPSLRFRQSNALFFIHYQFPYYFVRETSKDLFAKLLFAHHFCEDKSIFWRVAWKIYEQRHFVKYGNRNIPITVW